MIANLQPYPEYRPAGLPWLDSVPKHWDMIPNRALMQERREVVGEKAKDHTLLSLTLRGVIARDMVNPKGKFPAQFNTYKVVEPGDFVFCLFDIDETPRGVGLSPLKGMITGAYDVFSPRPITNPCLLYYYYLFVDDGKLMKPFYTGLRKTIQRGVFASLKSPCPPPEEQAAMVRFLDYANGRLERAIRAKRKVIALLHEQKQAIIHRAVTRSLPAEGSAQAGLDPTVPLKPSGIPWLGDIPKHWEVLRSKYLFREIEQRSATGQETRLSMSQKWGLVPSSRIEEKRLVSESGVNAKICEPGDIILNRLKAHLGVFALATERGLVSPDYTVFRPVRSMEARYFEAMYRTPACRVELRQRAKGIVQGFWRLYTDDFYDIRLPVPPVDEQTHIMAQLDIQLSGLNIAITRLEREIELLREYRTRLVADVVTGKLDVRPAAAKLPAVEPEVAAIEESSDETEAEAEAIATE